MPSTSFISAAIPAGLMPTGNRAPTMRQMQKLQTLADRTTIQRGPIKGRRMSDGFTPKVKVKATAAVTSTFFVTIESADNDNYDVTFTPGDVAGIPANINGTDLDDVDDSGNSPVLTVTPDNFTAHGNIQRALIMCRYDLDHETFAVLKATMFAAPKPPTQVPWVFNKLIAVLVKTADGTVTPWQRVFFSQYFLVANAAPAQGGFTPLPYVAS